MNIVVIPSWYPSPQHPYTGIFFREESIVYSTFYFQDNVGISLWGQNDERFLLWSKDHLKNLTKVKNRKSLLKSENRLADNCSEFFNPSFTWTLKIRKGNIRGIIRTNLENYSSFEKLYGKVNIILAHVGYPGGFIASEISKIKNIPYVIIENMSPLPFEAYITKKGDWIKTLRQAYEDSNKIIAVSQALKNKFENEGFKGVEVVYNFINDHEFLPLYTTDKIDKIKIIVVARLEHQKGLDILVEAASLIKGFDFEIEIIGDGSKETYLKQLIKDLNLSQKFIWRGYQPKQKIIEALQNANLFVLPSRHENLPLAFLEALACGKPCIGTRCGGPEEIISEEVGLIVEKENPQALAEAIIYMTENIDRYPQKKIRDYYEKNFSARQTVKKLRNIFEDVIKNHPLNRASASSK